MTYMFAFFCIDLRVRDVMHYFFQRIFRHFLNLDIQGGFHVVAGNGGLFANYVAVFVIFLGIVLTDNSAFSVNFVHTGSVNAVQVLFKCLLKAGFAHHGIHGVVLLFVFFPFVVGHTAQVAQHMGRVLGVVFPDGGRFDHQAGGIQLQQSRQVFVGNVFHKGIGRQVGDTAQVKLIQEADDSPGILIGPFLGNVIAFPQFLHQQRRGNVGVQSPVHHVLLEVALPGTVQRSQGILKGQGLGNGEVVIVGNTQFPALLHQTVQCVVTVGVRIDNVMVEHQVIGCTVAHQDVAVAVQDIPSGGTNRGQSGVDLGIIGITFCFDDLQDKQSESKQHQHECEQNKKQYSAKAAYSFHVFPPIKPIL